MPGQADLGTAVAHVKLDASGLRAGAAEAKQTMQRLSGDLMSLGRNISLGVSAPLAAFGVGALRTATQMDSLKRGLLAVAGSSEETERQLVRLREVAKLPGLGFKEAILGSVNLQAAGFSAQLAERSLKAFGNALATVGKGKAELDRVSLALTQMSQKTSGFGQDMRQLQEALPQVRKALMETFGTGSTEEIAAMGLTGQQVIERLVTEFEKLPAMTGGAQNSFENLQDALIRLMEAFGKPFLGPMADGLDMLASKLEEIGKRFESLPHTIQIALGGLAVGGIATGGALVGLAAILRAINEIKAAFPKLLPWMLRLGKLGSTIGAGWVIGQSLSEWTETERLRLEKQQRDRDKAFLESEKRSMAAPSAGSMIRNILGGRQPFAPTPMAVARVPLTSGGRFSMNEWLLAQEKDRLKKIEDERDKAAASGNNAELNRLAFSKSLREKEIKRLEAAIAMTSIEGRKSAADKIKAHQEQLQEIELRSLEGFARRRREALIQLNKDKLVDENAAYRAYNVTVSAIERDEENAKQAKLARDQALQNRSLDQLRKYLAELNKQDVRQKEALISFGEAMSALGSAISAGLDTMFEEMRFGPGRKAWKEATEEAEGWQKLIDEAGSTLDAFETLFAGAAKKARENAAIVQKAWDDAVSAISESITEAEDVERDRFKFDVDMNRRSLQSYVAYLKERRSKYAEYTQQWMADTREIKRAQDELDSRDIRKLQVGKMFAQAFADELYDAIAKALQRVFGRTFFGSLMTRFLNKLMDAIIDRMVKALVDAIVGAIGKSKPKKTGGGFLGALGSVVGAIFGGPEGAAIGGTIGSSIGFDDAGNDAMARRWGNDFGRQFSLGAREGVSRGFAPAMAGAGAGNQTIQITMPGMVIREDADVNRLAERLAWKIRLESRVRR